MRVAVQDLIVGGQGDEARLRLASGLLRVARVDHRLGDVQATEAHQVLAGCHQRFGIAHDLVDALH
eukprot:16035717-Heterocapsa_arctica.AAC.1